MGLFALVFCGYRLEQIGSSFEKVYIQDIRGMKILGPAHFIADWMRILWRKFYDVQYRFYQRVSIVGLFYLFIIFAMCARHSLQSLMTDGT